MQDEKLIELIAASAPQPPALSFNDVLARIEKQNAISTAQPRPRRISFTAVAAIAAAAVVLIGLSAVVLPLIGGMSTVDMAAEATEESAEMQNDGCPPDGEFFLAGDGENGVIPPATTNATSPAVTTSTQEDETSNSDLPAEDDETDESTKHEK